MVQHTDTRVAEAGQPTSPDGAFGGLPPESWAAHVFANLPLYREVREGAQVVQRVIDSSVEYPPSPGQTFAKTRLLCIDPGKFSNKVGGVKQVEVADQTEREAEPRFTYVIEPVTYKTATKVSYSSGRGRSTFRLISTSASTESDDRAPNEACLTGVEGIDGDAIEVYDAFYLRWRNWRYRLNWFTAIVKAMMALGLKPAVDEDGTEVSLIHNIALTVTLPNSELSDEQGNQTLDPRTAAALRDSKGMFELEWTDPAGKTWTWKVNVAKIFLVAQTMAGWTAIFNDLEGNPAAIIRQDEEGNTVAIEGDAVIDEWGGGDRQRGYIEVVDDEVTMWSEKIEEGTHETAQALRKAVRAQYKKKLTLAQAQVALYTRVIEVGGTPVSIDPLIADLKKTTMEKQVTSAVVTDEVRSKFWIHFGGGAALMRDEIIDYIRACDFKPHQYLVVPREVAALMPLIGGFAWGYMQMKEALRELQQEFEAQQTYREDLRRRLELAVENIRNARAGWGKLVESIQALLGRVSQVPAWPGHLSELELIDQDFHHLVPEQPWLQR